jgi:hypothetical protein
MDTAGGSEVTSKAMSDVYISGGRPAQGRKNVIIVTLDGREKRKRINAT